MNKIKTHFRAFLMTLSIFLSWVAHCHRQAPKTTDRRPQFPKEWAALPRSDTITQAQINSSPSKAVAAQIDVFIITLITPHDVLSRVGPFFNDSLRGTRRVGWAGAAQIHPTRTPIVFEPLNFFLLCKIPFIERSHRSQGDDCDFTSACKDLNVASLHSSSIVAGEHKSPKT